MNILVFLNSPKRFAFAVCAACVMTMTGYVFISGSIVLGLQWLRLEQYWRFLIVLGSVYFAWTKQKELRRSPVRPSFGTGIIVTALGCIFFVAWKLFLIDFIIELGLLLLIIGLISLLFGNNYAKILLLPVGYLVLTTSVVERTLAPVAVFMQYASATITEFALNSSGWEVLRDGRFLRLPHTVLEVASECSGAGQLTALIAFAIPLGFMMNKSWRSRIALLLLTIPFALTVNTIRIFLIALWNYDGMKTPIHGPYNILRMPTIYPLALVFLYLCSAFFARFENKTKRIRTGPAAPAAPPAVTSYKAIGIAWLCCFCLLAVSLAAIKFAEARPVQYTEDLMDFPLHINGWDCEQKSNGPPAGLLSFSLGKPDQALYRTYRNRTGDSLTLYMARFNVQNTMKRISSLQSGSFIQDEKKLFIDGGVRVLMTNAVFQKYLLSTASWFAVDNKTFPGVSELRKITIEKTLKQKRNNASFIAVSTGGGDPRLAEERLSSFVAAMFPYVKNDLR